METPPEPGVEAHTNADGKTAYRLTAKGRADRNSMGIAGDARDDETRPGRRTRHRRAVLGALITIFSGLLLGFMALAASMGVMILSSAGFCPDCVDESAGVGATRDAAALAGFVAYVIVALVLAYRSTDLSLVLVAIGSFIVGGILLFALAMSEGMEGSEGPLLISAAPLLLGIGSVLRLSERRGPLVTGGLARGRAVHRHTDLGGTVAGGSTWEVVRLAGTVAASRADRAQIGTATRDHELLDGVRHIFDAGTTDGARTAHQTDAHCCTASIAPSTERGACTCVRRGYGCTTHARSYARSTSKIR
jgi:hypothetical protein